MMEGWLNNCHLCLIDTIPKLYYNIVDSCFLSPRSVKTSSKKCYAPPNARHLTANPSFASIGGCQLTKDTNTGRRLLFSCRFSHHSKIKISYITGMLNQIKRIGHVLTFFGLLQKPFNVKGISKGVVKLSIKLAQLLKLEFEISALLTFYCLINVH